MDMHALEDLRAVPTDDPLFDRVTWRSREYAEFLLAWSHDGIPRGESEEQYAVRTGKTGMVSL